MTARLILYILFATATVAVRGSDPLVLSVEAPRVFQLGGELLVAISLANTSNEVVYLPRHYRHMDTVPAQLRVVITRSPSCAVTLVDFRNANAPPTADHQIVPLLPGERLTLALHPLNVNVLGQEIWPEAGKAILRVEYSTGQLGRAVLSAETPIEIVNPPDEEVERQRKALKSCIAKGGLQCERMIGYFAAVRDAAAADLLLELLRLHPYMFYVARAIANQGRTIDAAALDMIAVHEPAADRKFLTEMANRIRLHACTTCASSSVPESESGEDGARGQGSTTHHSRASRSPTTRRNACDSEYEL